MKHGRPLDDEHRGFENLSPQQQEKFKDLLEKKEGGGWFSPDDTAELNGLEEAMLNGKPIDKYHPNFNKNLDPAEQATFAILSAQKSPLIKPA